MNRSRNAPTPKRKESALKYTISLAVTLLVNWLLWSGHFDNAFLILLGVISIGCCLWIAHRMRIVDEEGAPVQLGLRPFTHYAPWLIKEIVVSNVEVAKIILSRKMPLQRNMVVVTTHQRSELGKVIYANSITLTPGTVAAMVRGNEILVHGLSLADTKQDCDGEMDSRICKLEKRP